MRKSLGALLAVATLLSLVVIGFSPAGAAGGTSCKGGTSTATVTPPWPPITSKAKVLDTVQTTAGALTGCSGGGVTGGSCQVSGREGEGAGRQLPVERYVQHQLGHLRDR